VKNVTRVVALFAGLAVLAALPRLVMEIVAGRAAQEVVVQAGAAGLSDEEKVVALARWSADHWVSEGESWIHRVTPFLYHRRLPEFVRVPRGSFELFLRRGKCDAVAAMLAFLLRSENLASRQHDLIDLSLSGHSALTVDLGQRRIYLDPYFGAAFRADGRLLSFEEVQERMRAGAPVERVALKEKAAFGFYENLPDMLHATAGAPLDIAVALPAVAEIGRIDGRSGDVESDGAELGLSTHQHFLGARYSRQWRKIYRVETPTRLTFTLTEPVSADALPQSNIAPAIRENEVEYLLDCRECELVLDPADVPWDWMRMKSWYEVDRLTATPLGTDVGIQ
jgi:hypothetical protein